MWVYNNFSWLLTRDNSISKLLASRLKLAWLKIHKKEMAGSSVLTNETLKLNQDLLAWFVTRNYDLIPQHCFSIVIACLGNRRKVGKGPGQRNRKPPVPGWLRGVCVTRCRFDSRPCSPLLVIRIISWYNSYRRTGQELCRAKPHSFTSAPNVLLYIPNNFFLFCKYLYVLHIL